jgi:hypothetical protein
MSRCECCPTQELAFVMLMVIDETLSFVVMMLKKKGTKEAIEAAL